MNDEEFCVLMMKLPLILGYNIELNLEPAIEFFEGMIGVGEVKGFLMKDPSVLDRSLEKWFKPRLAEVQEASGTLSRIAKRPEEQWSASTHQMKSLLLSKGEL
jgi:hypothetical protein